MSRESELGYYRRLYAEHGYNPRSARHDVTAEVCREYGLPGRWLDVGCGLHVVPVPEGSQLVRVDPAAPEVDYALAAHELTSQFCAGDFDVVTCFDVLEHVLPEDLSLCLDQLAEVCRRRLILSVGTDEGQEWAGRSAHLTVQPAEWWLDLLRGRFDDVRHVATSKGTSPFFVIDL